MNHYFAYIALFCFFSLFAFTNYSFAEKSHAPTSLKVKIKDIRSDKGQVLINLYDAKPGFPTKPEKALINATIPASQSEYEFTLNRTGEYAVAVCHDENANAICDTNFLGIPKEGVGTSRDAKGVMGPPKFKNAKISVNYDTNVAEITLSY